MFAKQIERIDRNAGHFVLRAEALVFPLETSFHKKTGRPGGIPREQALRNARMQVMRLFIRCARPADVRTIPVRAASLRRSSPRTGYLAMASGFKFD